MLILSEATGLQAPENIFLLLLFASFAGKKQQQKTLQADSGKLNLQSTIYNLQFERKHGMPGARTHDIITVVTGLALAPISYSGLIGLGQAAGIATRGAAILVAAHMLSGIMFSPDLDIDSAIDDRWGVFFWIWRPYMWAVPHRSRLLSHGLVLAPLLRLLYFYLVVAGLLIAYAWILAKIGIIVPDLHVRLANTLAGLLRDHPRESWCFIGGFITGSAAHSIADWLVTGGKRWLHRLGFRVTIDYAGHDRSGGRYGRSRARSWR